MASYGNDARFTQTGLSDSPLQLCISTKLLNMKIWHRYLC